MQLDDDGDKQLKTHKTTYRFMIVLWSKWKRRRWRKKRAENVCNVILFCCTKAYIAEKNLLKDRINSNKTSTYYTYYICNKVYYVAIKIYLKKKKKRERK